MLFRSSHSSSLSSFPLFPRSSPLPHHSTIDNATTGKSPTPPTCSDQAQSSKVPSLARKTREINVEPTHQSHESCDPQLSIHLAKHQASPGECQASTSERQASSRRVRRPKCTPRLMQSNPSAQPKPPGAAASRTMPKPTLG